MPILLVLASQALFASGRAEQDLQQAEQLVDEKEYDEALRILSEIIRREPDLFEAAEVLVERIRNAQNEFNDRYQELIEVLYDQGDVEEALRIIDELERLDPNPNDATAQAIAQAKRGALVQANRIRFDALMDEALALLQAGEAREAVQLYLEGGFVFHREEFEAADNGNIVEAAVEEALNSVFASAATFLEQSVVFDEEIGALEQSVLNRDIEQMNAVLQLQRERLVRLNVQMETAASAARTFENQRSVLGESQNASELFLYYSEKVIRGRPDREREEGLLTAESAMLQDAASAALIALKQAVEEGRSEPETLYQEGQWVAAAASFRAVQPYVRAYMELSHLIQAGGSLDQQYDPWTQEPVEFPADAEQFLLAQEYFMEHEALWRLAEVRQDVETGLAAEVTTETLASGIRQVEALGVRWDRYEGQLEVVEPQLAERAARITDLLAQTILEWRLASVSLLAPRLTELSEEFEEERRMHRQGTTVVLEGGSVRVERYPGRRLTAFNRIRDELDALREDLESALGERSGIADVSERLQTVLDETRELAERADEMAGAVEEEIASATNDIVAAEGFRRQGDEQFRTAESAFGRAQYDNAREAVERAAEAYDRSLALREDPAVRERRDRGLPALLARINLGENNRVVGEVRQLVEQAKSAYRRQDFEEAERHLLTAQSRWGDTNSLPNAEVEDWLTLVRRALELQQGWELVETQPLYTEIVQFLKFASDDFDRGVTFATRGETDQAEIAFNAARQKLDTISITAPRLRSANVLRLRILRRLEPEAFAQELASLKQRAGETVRRGLSFPSPEDVPGPVLEQLQEQNRVLKEFRDVVGQDAELNRLIEQVEIALGIRERPPTPAQLARSVENTRSAAQIYEDRQRDLYPQAVRLLDEAIRLNPENSQAILLKDRILTARGGTVEGLISSDAQRQVEQAQQYFADRNYLQALDIVRRLLSNPSNRNYPPLIDLRDQLAQRGYE